MTSSENRYEDKQWCHSVDCARELLSSIENTARQAFEQDGHCIPVAVLWTFRNPQPPFEERETMQSLVVGTEFLDGTDSKDVFSQILQKIARDVDAFALAFVSESRVLRVDPSQLDKRPGESTEAAYQRWRRAQPASFKDVRGYKEIVMVSFEHRALKGSCLSTAEITREVPGDEDSAGTLHEFVRGGGFSESTEYSSVGGRFVSMLPAARGD